ncbi:AAA family ATPase, partial [Lactococcus garvieae]|uniref:AAA family ATPase n=1 Tax=Lactococcus garvieae TaxID=1363 RepID=UPI00254BA750
IVLLKESLPHNLRFSYSLETLKFLEKGKKYSEVSDGIRAFVGILLEIIAGDLEIILIDEIEAFLHAPLSRKLGKILSKVSKEKNKQLFITTHNTNFIMGCIDSGADFNILRLTYNDEVGEARLIKKNELKKIVKNPLLRSSGVFEGMFYKNVIVCEADSDRIFYQEINYRLQEFNDTRFIEDCLFLNARNK